MVNTRLVLHGGLRSGCALSWSRGLHCCWKEGVHCRGLCLIKSPEGICTPGIDFAMHLAHLFPERKAAETFINRELCFSALHHI